MKVVANGIEHHFPIVAMLKTSMRGIKAYDVTSEELIRLCTDMYYEKPDKIRLIKFQNGDTLMATAYHTHTFHFRVCIDESDTLHDEKCAECS